jgi:hypothetical protein
MMNVMIAVRSAPMRGGRSAPVIPLHHQRYQEEEPEDHQDQRDRAHQVDVGGRGERQRLDARQACQGEQRAEEEPADRRDRRQLDRVLEALPQIGQRVDDDRVIEIHRATCRRRCSRERRPAAR